jgi:TRAP-type C4-dicarboxylate transport system permease small subunit
LTPPSLQRFAERAIDVVAIAAFCGMFGCVLAQVVFRYFLGDPLVWSDELARYLFVWCAFLGWIVAARRRSHLRVAVAHDRLPARGQAVLAFVGAVAVLAFASLLGYQGWRIAARNWDVGTTTLPFAMGLVYAIVPVAAIAVGLYGLADLARAWRRLGAR